MAVIVAGIVLPWQLEMAIHLVFRPALRFIQTAVADRFLQVPGGNVRAVVQVGDSACNFQDSVYRPRRKCKTPNRFFHQQLLLCGQSANAIDPSQGQVGIQAAALTLQPTGMFDTDSYRGAVFARPLLQLSPGNARHFDLQIDAVQ